MRWEMHSLCMLGLSAFLFVYKKTPLSIFNNNTLFFQFKGSVYPCNHADSCGVTCWGLSYTETSDIPNTSTVWTNNFHLIWTLISVLSHLILLESILYRLQKHLWITGTFLRRNVCWVFQTSFFSLSPTNDVPFTSIVLMWCWEKSLCAVISKPQLMRLTASSWLDTTSGNWENMWFLCDLSELTL